jgi:hypothetical protein
MALIAFSAMFITGCSKTAEDNAEDDTQVEYYPGLHFVFSGDSVLSTWQFIGKNDTIFTFPDNSDSEPSAVVNGIFSVCANGKYAYADKPFTPIDDITLYKFNNGKPTVIPNCSGLVCAGYANQGLIPVCRMNERIMVVDTDGNVKFTLNPIDSLEVAYSDVTYSNGMLCVTLDNGMQTYVDVNGNQPIKQQYNYCSRFNDGLAYGQLTETSTFFVFDTKGNVKFELAAGYMPIDETVHNGKLIARKNNGDSIASFMWYDLKTGKATEIGKDVYGIYSWNDNVFTYTSEASARTGVMDFSGKVVVEPKYELITLTGGLGCICTCGDNEVTVYDDKGKEKYHYSGYMTAYYVKPIGYFGATEDGAMYLLNEDGTRRSKDGCYKGINFNEAFDSYVTSQYNAKYVKCAKPTD